jgi:uncharacterized protein YdiU (UPF0061 family)
VTAFGAHENDASAWLNRYRSALREQDTPEAERMTAMRSTNPAYVLRNYLAQAAIERAQRRDFSEVGRLLAALRAPFDERPQFEDYAKPAPDWAQSIEVSCSS